MRKFFGLCLLLVLASTLVSAGLLSFLDSLKTTSPTGGVWWGSWNSPVVSQGSNGERTNLVGQGAKNVNCETGLGSPPAVKFASVSNAPLGACCLRHNQCASGYCGGIIGNPGIGVPAKKAVARCDTIDLALNWGVNLPQGVALRQGQKVEVSTLVITTLSPYAYGAMAKDYGGSIAERFRPPTQEVEFRIDNKPVGKVPFNFKDCGGGCEVTSSTVKVKLPNVVLPLGKHTITAIVDPNNAQPETDENNNKVSTQFNTVK